ncbi:catalase-like domain-containing protein [Leucosporidium creatinivorum]|uniref:catalase n=1 Tax=Leucosporidium creatinivorum TaxID=106004 RepID=A0A1Y2E4Y7_9BASI|nr:catalase-like domain-containing protein [Leucosporidium creatinivorum]
MPCSPIPHCTLSGSTTLPSTGVPATFSSLRTLSLDTVTLPQDIDSFSKSFPHLSELAICFHADVLLEGEAREPSNLHFVVAVAPQLVILRLNNGPRTGIPLSLIHNLITIGICLERLDSTIILDYKLPPPPPPARFDLTNLPSLELRFILHSWRSTHMLVTDPRPPQERLWALFKSRDAGAVKAISTLRRVERVVLEPWLVERFPDGPQFGVQLVSEEDEELFDFDLLDCTKLIPEELVPIKWVGTLELNKNPTHYFAETEQLQLRVFSYFDTQLSRLGGPNFSSLPINRGVYPFTSIIRNGHSQDWDDGCFDYRQKS